MIIPPYLKPGDTIGIVTPAGYMLKDKAAECIRVLQQEWGFNVLVGKNLGSRSRTYFSGTDAQRRDELQAMMDDKNIQAILCARGGYGMGRIIDQLDFTAFKRHPKWIIGFSDITVLHAQLFKKYKIASIHGPMAAAFNNGEYKKKYVRSLKDVLTGKKIAYAAGGNRLNREGIATATLVGGNLSLLVHSIGTATQLNTAGCILFIEDIGEQLYNIDRMMTQLHRSGMLKGLKGMIVGRFSDMKDTDRPFGKSIYFIIESYVATYNFPVCYHFPISHDAENYAIKHGMIYELKVDKKQVTLIEK